MQQRDGMSDEELLSYVALHHPNLLDGLHTTFGAKLFSEIEAKKGESSSAVLTQDREDLIDKDSLRHIGDDPANSDRLDSNVEGGLAAGPSTSSPDGLVTLFPWIPWSEADTANTQQIIMTVFEKEPAALDGDQAGFLLEMLEAERKGNGEMFLVVPKLVAESIEEIGGISMDPSERDSYGRLRLPEIVKEIGLSQDVIDEMGWDWQ